MQVALDCVPPLVSASNTTVGRLPACERGIPHHDDVGTPEREREGARACVCVCERGRQGGETEAERRKALRCFAWLLSCRPTVVSGPSRRLSAPPLTVKHIAMPFSRITCVWDCLCPDTAFSAVHPVRLSGCSVTQSLSVTFSRFLSA
ncbi:hypothetical protein K431DRAFT_84527 [Polychaeton citri CBS 116435]|uniref:Uncharacterized protein n=1 Tax=Polychaeton citri CBS 116435 TaxID=1314669 RepID=A0A9P4UNU0_9PEZI|nr:hypothetical protein K431DRAFT_84527 [Polychaeton citri CBS 116435]